VTTEKFKSYQGFDLVNFSDHQYPLTDVNTYKILKSETYGVFKGNMARIFKVLPEQVRFWIFMNRQNKTTRPDTLIPESYFNISNKIVILIFFFI